MAVKVTLQIYPMIPAADEAEREALRPIGRNSERYQQTIQQCHGGARACDELGLCGVACIEHHFHSEGYEVGPSPGLLNAYCAAITSRVRVWQLGCVMSAQRPIASRRRSRSSITWRGDRVSVLRARQPERPAPPRRIAFSVAIAAPK